MNDSFWNLCVYGRTKEAKLKLDHYEKRKKTFIGRILKSMGLELNINEKRYPSGNTILHIVCKKNYIDIVKLLLTVPEIDVNIKNNRGNTALMEACYCPRTEIIKILLGHPGIDVNTKNNDRETALTYICRSEHIISINMPVGSKHFDTIKIYYNKYIETIESILEHPGFNFYPNKHKLISTKYPKINILIKTHYTKILVGIIPLPVDISRHICTYL